ncbi:hypothetical protein [Enteractinococcus helveticum]|uniref:hypothetical protein n=1 Tax=Enteractinococcus helveticum TaxID=1837282 RepID=UPI000ABBB476|nr:hypothetical protein [Enteractinococcus helveticum]
MSTTVQHPRHLTEHDSSFVQLQSDAIPGDIVRRVEQLHSGTLIATQGAIATISDKQVTDRGGAILAQAEDDDNEHLTIFHTASLALLPNVEHHHWVMCWNTGWIFFADPEAGYYKEVTTHTIRQPQSFDAWTEMALGYANTPSNRLDHGHAWTPVTNRTQVKAGDMLVRHLQLPTGTTVEIKGAVAELTGNSGTDQEHYIATTADDAVLLDETDYLAGGQADPVVDIWQVPQPDSVTR